ncbi:hypothetical protein ACFFJN_04595 [Erwinia mallotivora]|uniref:hypothetical protein n=1 Tax=Erwinia mallotivora TaxID=69222 RepID=UPI0035E8AA51
MARELKGTDGLHDSVGAGTPPCLSRRNADGEGAPGLHGRTDRGGGRKQARRERATQCEPPQPDAAGRALTFLSGGRRPTALWPFAEDDDVAHAARDGGPTPAPIAGAQDITWITRIKPLSVAELCAEGWRRSAGNPRYVERTHGQLLT